MINNVDSILTGNNKITSNFINNPDRDIESIFIDSNNYIYYRVIMDGLNRSL